jgi:hypothetical protein
VSTGASLVVIVSGLIIVAAAWIGITRSLSKPTEPIVAWLRPDDSGVRHAFWSVELSAEPCLAAVVEPVAHCGRWPAVELTADDVAPRCAPCERAVSRIEEHRQE